jgi:chloramphenicol O-acetyltransferase type A
MKTIDISKWNRKKYYEYYKNYQYPLFSINVDIDISLLIKYIKSKELSFFSSFLYVVMKAINQIDEFKYRIREDTVILHDVVHPSYTVLNDEDNYVFCNTDFTDSFNEFIKNVKNSIDIAKKGDNLEDDESKDDLIFISSLPWISFQSVTHPIDTANPDSFPRVTFGKYRLENNIYKIPLSIAAHHGLCDGLHVARFLKILDEEIKDLTKN